MLFGQFIFKTNLRKIKSKIQIYQSILVGQAKKYLSRQEMAILITSHLNMTLVSIISLNSNCIMSIFTSNLIIDRVKGTLNT